MSERAENSGKNKPPLSMVPYELQIAVAEILRFGCTAKGYDKHNWLKGMPWTEAADKAMRHMNEWIHRVDKGAGPGIDPESGKSALWHAATIIAMLVTYEVRGLGVDDRYVEAKTEKPKEPEIRVGQSWRDTVDKDRYLLVIGKYRSDQWRVQSNVTGDRGPLIIDERALRLRYTLVDETPEPR